MNAHYSETFIFFGELILNLFFIIIALFVIYNLLKLGESLRKKTKLKIHYLNRLSILIVSSFSFLGFAIGLLVGFSISPVVQVVIPALLTFYGGFLTYIISKESIVDQQRYISVLLSAMAISFFLIYGIEIGTAERNKAVANNKEMDLRYLQKEEAIKKQYR